MTATRRFSVRYLTRQLAYGHAVLANPKATDLQRHHARCRINRTIDIMRRLVDIPPMTRELATDRVARKARARLSPAG